jgi:hypothetical protein
MFLHIVKNSMGKVLTGKIWRKQHAFFKDLPFYSNITRMDEMTPPLQEALGQDKVGKYSIKHLTLIVFIFE